MKEDDSHSRVEMARSDKSVWLMKCPVVVAKSLQNHPPSDPSPVGRVVVSYDPLNPKNPSEFTMEMASTEPGNKPKIYSLNMSKDFVPMCVFSEASQGRVVVEGKVEHKFDMKLKN